MTSPSSVPKSLLADLRGLIVVSLVRQLSAEYGAELKAVEVKIATLLAEVAE